MLLEFFNALKSQFQSLPCQHHSAHCQSKQESWGATALQALSAPQKHISATFLVLMKYKETDITRSFLFQQTHPGRDSEHRWSQSRTASTKPKVILFGKWNGDSLQLLNLENTVESRPAYLEVFAATPTFYLCSSFTHVRRKTVHSHMLLITSQLQGLHFIPTPENRKSWLTCKTYLPSLNQLRK